MSAGASAQELPGADKLLQIAGDELPPYWNLSDLTVVATTREGDAADPRAVIRFEANASPSDPLFVDTGQEGPFTIVVPTEGQETSRRLYGVFDLGYRAGNWSGDVNIENPVTSLGQPRNLFDRPTLIQGTEQAATRLSELRNNDIAAAVAAHEAEMTRLQGEHKKTVAKIIASQGQTLQGLENALEEKVNAKRTEYAKALDATRAKGEREVSALRQKYQAQIAELTGENEPIVAKAKAEREKALAVERDKTRAALQSIREEQNTEIETLKTEHAKRRGALIEAQRQEMAELETKLATERASLERQVEAGEEVVRLQGQLSTLLEERALGAARQMDAFEAARKARVDFFARLPQNWSGQVRCHSDQEKVDRTVSTSIKFEEPTSNGVMAKISTEGSLGVKATLVFLDDALSFPIRMRVRARYLSSTIIPQDFEVTINQDGRMVGERKLQWTVDKRPVNVTCAFRLAAAG